LNLGLGSTLVETNGDPSATTLIPGHRSLPMECCTCSWSKENRVIKWLHNDLHGAVQEYLGVRLGDTSTLPGCPQWDMAIKNSSTRSCP
jgi:hypothetical protein